MPCLSLGILLLSVLSSLYLRLARLQSAVKQIFLVLHFHPWLVCLFLFTPLLSLFT